MGLDIFIGVFIDLRIPAALLAGVGELEQAYQSQPGPDRKKGGRVLCLCNASEP